MQMRGRRYIRFDFTQALHTRATSAEPRDYRIIARARASDHSSTTALARGIDTVATLHGFAREALAPQPAEACTIPAPPIFYGRLRGSSLLVKKQLLALTNAQKSAINEVHLPQRAYQIETARTLFAIEFFLAGVITFFSQTRCNRRLSRS
jgi:hypothetical protein